MRLQMKLGYNNLFDEEYFEVRAGKGLFLGPPAGWNLMFGFSIEL